MDSVFLRYRYSLYLYVQRRLSALSFYCRGFVAELIQLQQAEDTTLQVADRMSAVPYAGGTPALPYAKLRISVTALSTSSGVFTRLGATRA
jgi:uncharacterized glyoxalase superfamily protein PhnB